MLDDCSKKGKKAIQSIILILIMFIMLEFREYINVTILMLYIIIIGLFSLKSIPIYIYCLTNNTKKLKK